MKRVIIGLVIALASAQSASADGIRSPLGMSQADWNASETYKNFVCPQGTSRGEGVDMNFTTNRSDDFYFVTCKPTVIYVEPIKTVTPVPLPVPASTKAETSTATSSAPQPVQTTTPKPTPIITPVAVTDTATAINTVETSTPIIKTTVTVIETPTVTTKTVTSILDEELDLTWDWDKILAWIIAWFDSIWIRL
jgi:hypothetical protein